MPKENTASAEFNDLKEDLASLKSDVETLSKSLSANGAEQAGRFREQAKAKIHHLSERGREGLHKVEEQVQDKPGQSLAIAFAAGFLTNMLLRHRR
ncbi:MAG: hypothetical protein EP348_06935 [Alphaproteobacteria bacterium]|nr:MAG: hypothetical protein EP348_06935 [Alphaproteobacteria bacterium]